MFRPFSLEDAIPEQSGWLKFKNFLYKLGNSLEMLLILALWLLVFTDTSIFHDYTKAEIITYIIAGNIISLITGYFMYRLIAAELNSPESKLLIYRPWRYFIHVFKKNTGSYLLPFVISIFFDIFIIYLFLDNFIINLDINYLAVIIIMIALSFVIELLLAYLANLYIFWTFTARDAYLLLNRLKKFLAGAYFPLNLLPPIFVSISLFLPFAYSFFAPMQLYLKKITIATGLRGLGIELFWIIILYTLVQLAWQKRIKKQQQESIK